MLFIRAQFNALVVYLQLNHFGPFALTLYPVPVLLPEPVPTDFVPVVWLPLARDSAHDFVW